LRSLNFVEAIYLYGSRARGNYRPHSDIDIALKLHDNKPNYRHIIADIIEHADTLLAIDCVNIDEAPEALKRQIVKEGVLLFENKYDDIPF
jgi:predicted nucleotidyltransferase